MNNAQFQKYPAYKDSRAPWIGDIPSHWKIEKGKWLFIKNERPVRKIDEIVTCFRDGEVTLRSKRRTDGFTNALKEHGYQGIRKGDLVIHAMDAFAGSIGVSDSDGKSTPVYSVCTERFENAVNQYYYAYFLRNLALNGVILSLAKGIRERSTDFRFKDFGELLLVVPPLPEQTAIANFLDDKTAKIDQAIAQKEKMIELLKERKQIIIQDLVTGKKVWNKSKNAWTEPVEVKDSGVEWIGKIPEHWEVKKIKHIVKKSFSGGTPSTDKLEYWDGGISWVSSVDIKTDLLSETAREISEKGLKHSSSNIAPKDSIVFVTRSGILQHTFALSILEKDMAINQDIKCLIFSKKLFQPYFLRLIQGNNSKILVETRQQAATVESINMDSFFNLPIPFPSLTEQLAIVTYIQTQSSKIDQAISLQQTQIEKLKEYKATLIDSAVTGKLRVPSVQEIKVC
jgi:type I restriction enzyme S subunit